MSPKPQPHYDLPTGGAAREALRVKGQFWTPAWTAEAMVEFALERLLLPFDVMKNCGLQVSVTAEDKPHANVKQHVADGRQQGLFIA